MPTAETTPTRDVNQDKLMQFLGKALGDMGGAMSAALVSIGDRLGLYKALAANGGLTPGDLAKQTGTAERYVREWLLNQAAGGYIDYNPAKGTYSMSPEQAFCLANEQSPVFLAGAFDVIQSVQRDEPKIRDAFKSGRGVAWGEHDACLFCGTERFFAGSYRGHLVQEWLPALDGVVAKLKTGADVADVGCGHGASTLIMAAAFPNSRFVGFDSHGPSVECANKKAKEAGLAGRVRFEVADATKIPPPKAGSQWDLICMFDCLHDMGDPVGACRSARGVLKKDGTLMLVEPNAGDTVESNFNPIARIFAAASTMICVPASLASNGPALGACAGENRLTRVVKEGGFTKVRRATETPFNMVLEARP